MTAYPLRACLALIATLGLAGCDAPSGGASTVIPEPAAPAVEAPVAAESHWPFAGEGTGDASAVLSPAALMASNYYVVFDASGSMSEPQCDGWGTKIAVAKQAIIDFADKVPKDANLGMSVFQQDGIQEIVPIGPLDRGAVASVVADVMAGGRTPLSESIERAYAALTAQGRRQQGYGEYHLIVVTDGESTDADPAQVVDRVLSESPVVMHTIGFCIGEQHSLNQPGRVLYRPAGSAEELAEGFSSVLAEAPSFDLKSFK